MGATSLTVPAHTHGHDSKPYLPGTPGSHREQQILIDFPHGRTNNDHFANDREGDWKLTTLWEERFLPHNLANDPTEDIDLAQASPWTNTGNEDRRFFIIEFQ